jgi:uncharacterized coiled-coil protein SlyX
MNATTEELIIKSLAKLDAQMESITKTVNSIEKTMSTDKAVNEAQIARHEEYITELYSTHSACRKERQEQDAKVSKLLEKVSLTVLLYQFITGLASLVVLGATVYKVLH